MLALLAQAVPTGFWRAPSAWDAGDSLVTLLLAVVVTLLWVRFARWRKTMAPIIAKVGKSLGQMSEALEDVATLKGDVATLKGDVSETKESVEGLRGEMVEMRQSILGHGEALQRVATELGTDIVMSEERIVKKVGEVADAQISLMQALANRPCIKREQDADCPESET